MNWEFNVKYSEQAQKQFKKLDKQISKKIIEWIENRLCNSQNPRLWGEPLVTEFTGLWKYLIGNYRLICKIKDDELVVLVFELGHRKEVYK